MKIDGDLPWSLVAILDYKRQASAIMKSLKILEINKNQWKWIKFNGNGLKLMEMDWNGLKLIKMVEVNGNGLK